MLQQKGKWGGEHYLLQRTCPYFNQAYPLTMAGYGSCFLFVCSFVCMFSVLRVKAKSRPVMIMSREKQGQSRVGKIDLILSAWAANQNTRYISFTVPPRDVKGEGTQTIAKLLSCEGSFGLACTSVSYLFLSLSLIKRDLVSSFQLANIRFSRFCKKEIH